MSSFTSSTLRPTNGSAPAVKRPASSTGQLTPSPARCPTAKSSLPWPGAVCTSPVPSSRLTNGVPSTTGESLPHGPSNTAPSSSRPVRRASTAWDFQPAASATPARRASAIRKRPPVPGPAAPGAPLSARTTT